MTDVNVLVLTDDELTCIAGANKAAWALPLGADRDAAAVHASGLAGERSLVARGFIGPEEGRYALSTEVFEYVQPCLQGAPGLIVFTIDDRFSWVLQGMSLAWYRGEDAGVLEIRAANGLHHFTAPTPAALSRALGNFLTIAHESGFPDVERGAALSLCAVVPSAERAYRVAKDAVTVAVTTGEPLASLTWEASSLGAALEELVAVPA